MKDIPGYRRTAVKTKDPEKLKQKLEEFHDRGEKTIVKGSGGYSYIFVRIEKEVDLKQFKKEVQDAGGDNSESISDDGVV